MRRSGVREAREIVGICARQSRGPLGRLWIDGSGAFLHSPAPGIGRSRVSTARWALLPSREEELMKETVLDVLMYLFETFIDSDDEPEPNRNELREELVRAGFGDREIDRALEWLDGLNTGEGVPDDAPRSAAIRVYDRGEQERLDSPSRGYLLHLEQIGILPPAQRELVIDRLLALDSG